MKLDKKLNALEEIFVSLEDVAPEEELNNYPLMYNYATVSKAANRLQTIFYIKNKGFNATDAHDYEYSKIKLSILLFEISFYYQNFEGTSDLLKYLKKFHALVKKRNHEFAEANKDSGNNEADRQEQELATARLPLYNSIIYGSETYHNSNQVEYNYNKSELDIMLIFMKIFY